MASTLIRNASWVVAWDAAAKRHVYQRDRDIDIVDGAIAAIRPAAPGRAGPTAIDGAGKLVMPGLVNIHSHPTTEPSLRGVREDHGVPEQQMTGLFERAQAFRLSPEGRRAAVELACSGSNARRAAGRSPDSARRGRCSRRRGSCRSCPRR